MIRVALSMLFVMATAGIVSADWRVYNEDGKIIASFDYVSFAPFGDQPSVWVKWHYVTPRNGLGGIKIQFTANCPEHRLFEIDSIPYNTDGKYLAEKKSYDSPKEYRLTSGSLDQATFKLLCH